MAGQTKEGQLQQSEGLLAGIGSFDIGRTPSRALAASRHIPFLATPAVEGPRLTTAHPASLAASTSTSTAHRTAPTKESM